jgi:cytochrome P450
MVRIAPNELSFATATSLQTIYGHAKPGEPQFIKSLFYYHNRQGSILSERDPEKHRVQRRSLWFAFSPAVLRDQADIVLGYVNTFIEQVRRHGNAEDGIDITEVRLSHDST